jgi:hypothetical protein
MEKGKSGKFKNSKKVKKSVAKNMEPVDPDIKPEDIIPVNPMVAALESRGITADYLANMIVEELSYKAPVRVAVYKNGNGKKGKGNGEPEMKLTRLDTPQAMRVRQAARDDAHKFRSDFPPERKEFSGPDGKPIPVKMYDFDDSGFPEKDN